MADLHSRLTMPAATFGCWFGVVLSPCGVVITFRRVIKIWSDGSQKRADSSAGSWRNGRLPTAARDQLREIGEASGQIQLTGSMSAVVILAQTRSMVVDLIQLTGMDYHEARELIPDID